MHNRTRTIFLGISILFFCCISAPAQAFTFTKDNLLTDREFTDTDWLSTNGIQSFLEEQGSILAHTVATDIDGTNKSVAEIIHRVSEDYTLNPMLFIVLAQKESSAITSGSMTDAISERLLGFGVCDSCSYADAQQYAGITTQLESAGYAFRDVYFARLETYGQMNGWGVGITKNSVDGISVTPENKATAALYIYNPWVGAYGGGDSRYGANSLFQKLWQLWNPATRYPNGSLIKIGDTTYLIQKGKKRAFTSQGALLANYDTNQVVSVSAVVGEQYPDGAPIAYSNYSLLQVPSGGVYMYINGTKRPISSKDLLFQLGFYEEEIIPVADTELEDIPEGPVIDERVLSIGGFLIQNTSNGAVAYVDEEGVRHDIWSKEILDNNFSHPQVVAKSATEFSAYTVGDPLGFKDGTLVRNTDNKRIFVISNGKKRAFPSKKAFAKYGYSWDNVIKVSSTILSVHPKGRAMPKP